MVPVAQKRHKTDGNKEGGKEKMNSDIAVYSLHLQLPSSARLLLSLEVWRGKMGENNCFETTLKQTGTLLLVLLLLPLIKTSTLRNNSGRKMNKPHRN